MDLLSAYRMVVVVVVRFQWGSVNEVGIRCDGNLSISAADEARRSDQIHSARRHWMKTENGACSMLMHSAAHTTANSFGCCFCRCVNVSQKIQTALCVFHVPCSFCFCNVYFYCRTFRADLARRSSSVDMELDIWIDVRARSSKIVTLCVCIFENDELKFNEHLGFRVKMSHDFFLSFRKTNQHAWGMTQCVIDWTDIALYSYVIFVASECVERTHNWVLSLEMNECENACTYIWAHLCVREWVWCLDIWWLLCLVTVAAVYRLTVLTPTHYLFLFCKMLLIFAWVLIECQKHAG